MQTGAAGKMSLFRPCIDLHDGKVKQIVGSTLSDSESTVKTNFVAEHDSSWFAELYRRDGLTGGHVIKLGPGNDEAAKRALAAYPGGLAAGAGQVIVTSYIFADGELKRDRLEKLFRSTGRDRLVLDLSCRRLPGGGYRIVTDRWQKFTTLAVDAAALNQLADYACEFLVHAVDVEGRQSGIDAELLGILAEHSPIPCVYAGGIRNFDDIEQVRRAGNGRIGYTIGSALDIFGGPLSYAEVVRRS